MGEKAVNTYTYEAYLALEAESDIKYEFHDGMITAMSGGTPAHSQITMNFGRALPFIKDCIFHSSDLKIHVEATNRSYFS